MKAFVTGGTGFIGSHLVDALLEDSKWSEVKCLVRNREKWLTGKEYTRVKGDLHSISVLKQALHNVDVIFHLAGVVKAPSRKEFDYGNVEATENLIRVAQKTGIGKIVVLSSLAAAGPSRDHPLTEEDPMKPVSQYGESKKKMEMMIHKLSSADSSITILRPPAVYGPREDQIYTYFKLVNKRISPVIGDGETPRISMIYVSDLIRGIQRAAESPEPGISTYFITGPDIYNWNQIKNISSKVLGKKPVTLNIKPSWVKKLAGIFETTASFTGSYPAFNRDKANEMVLEWTCSGEKAETELNYSPDVSLEEGISRTLHWYKKHYWL
ncbi:MAG: NAD-dependent epimerase/dehydratase family protein [Balneolaceae bacterium]